MRYGQVRLGRAWYVVVGFGLLWSGLAYSFSGFRQ